MKIKRLSKKEQWESRWSSVERTDLSFDPSQPLFRQTHGELAKHLPNLKGGRFLEVGAYPGKYLWYFHGEFDCEPWGVEYVESCAARAQELLDKAGLSGQIICDDFFKLGPERCPGGQGWDLVASFGFVEHFDEPGKAVAQHFEVAKPGGYVVVSVPNHSGWNGPIMKAVDREKWSQHNGMSRDDMMRAFAEAGDHEILYSGYVGHIGFWNTCLYETIKSSSPRLYPFVRAPLWLIEHIGRYLVPNNRLTSPDILVIARKKMGVEQ